MDSILGRSQVKGAIQDPDTVLSRQAVSGTGHSVTTTGNDQVILGNDSVTVSRSNSETTGSVKCQILLGKDNRVNVVIIDLYKFTGGGKGVIGTVSQSNKYLIGIFDIDRGTGFTAECQIRKNQLYLVIIRRINDDLACAEDPLRI